MTTSQAVAVRVERPAHLILLIIAIVCFLLAAFGVTDKLGFNIVDAGLAAFAGSFIF